MWIKYEDLRLFLRVHKLTANVRNVIYGVERRMNEWMNGRNVTAGYGTVQAEQQWTVLGMNCFRVAYIIISLFLSACNNKR